ncbi:hypothetical protein [Nocardia jiangxiensis]|uniref:hypothetical protein n=1 Tax=Nocardia jiangxiensis TaxID=282685 RepID=UPI0005942A35|nr:hypothetical protein [Nocardia jiangxiensis]
MTSVWQIVFQVASVTGFSGALVYGVRAVMDRKKIRVDNTQVLTGISMKQVNEWQEDMETMKTRMRRYEQALWTHARWDRMVVDRLAKLGVDDVPDPPELWI